MDPVRPEFVPDASLSRDEMEVLQRDIAETAVFADDLPFDPADVTLEAVAGSEVDDADGSAQTRIGDADADPGGSEATVADRPLVAGVDQAFVDDRAVSAIVVMRGGDVIERVHAVADTEIPYVPGLLSFREGGAILAAFAALEHDPDVALVDGSGRIHFREAGLATHVGVTLDLPTVGVAKSLLCGTPRESLDRTLSEGTRVPIDATDDVETVADGTPIGYAVQTRQFESGNRYVNPLIVSAGHRMSSDTAADLVLRTSAGYKLPEPTRLADSYADEVKAEVRDDS